MASRNHSSRFVLAAAASAVWVLQACGGGQEPETLSAQAVSVGRDTGDQERRTALAATDLESLSAVERDALRLHLAFYGTPPDISTHQNLVKQINTVGASRAAASLADLVRSTPDQVLAKRILDNLSVTTTTVTTPGSYSVLLDAVGQIFAAFGPNARGQIVLNAVTLLSGLRADPTFGVAATAFLSRLDTAARQVGTTAPPAGALAINQSNHLDVLATSALARQRVSHMTLIVDDIYKGIFAVGDQPGTYPCPGGGTVTIAASGGLRVIRPSGCRLTAFTYQSGTVEISNITNLLLPPLILLNTADVQIKDLSYLPHLTDRFNFPQRPTTVSGDFRLRPAEGTALMGAGKLAYQVAGKTDTYSVGSVTSLQRTVLSTVGVANGQLTINAARLAVGPLTNGITAVSNTVTAADGSLIRFDQPALDQLMIEVLPKTGSTPTLSRSVSIFDADLAAAVRRAVE